MIVAEAKKSSGKVTAKVKLASVTPSGDVSLLQFEPDYQDDRNQEWAAATPHLQLSMTVKADVASNFEPGAYTLTFEKNED